METYFLALTLTLNLALIFPHDLLSLWFYQYHHFTFWIVYSSFASFLIFPPNLTMNLANHFQSVSLWGNVVLWLMRTFHTKTHYCQHIRACPIPERCAGQTSQCYWWLPVIMWGNACGTFWRMELVAKDEPVVHHGLSKLMLCMGCSLNIF